jgi:hypothetical protein
MPKNPINDSGIGKLRAWGWRRVLGSGHTSSTNRLSPGAPVRLPKETRLEGYGEKALETCEDSGRSAVY